MSSKGQCPLENWHHKDMCVERDWTTCSNIVNYCKFNNQHNWVAYMTFLWLIANQLWHAIYKLCQLKMTSPNTFVYTTCKVLKMNPHLWFDWEELAAPMSYRSSLYSSFIIMCIMVRTYLTYAIYEIFYNLPIIELLVCITPKCLSTSLQACSCEIAKLTIECFVANNFILGNFIAKK